MIKKYTLFKIATVILIAYILIDSVGLLRDVEEHPFREVEMSLGLNSKHHWSFHSILENKERNGLRFPGYVIGIEKAAPEYLGISHDRDVYDNIPGNKASISAVRSAVNDSERLFLSHIMNYSVTSKPMPRVVSSLLYSTYEENPEDSNRFAKGQEALIILKDHINQRLQNEAITHLFILTVGWNTPQIEAIGDMNGIMGYLLDHVASDPQASFSGVFNPLVIGVTWPATSRMSAADYLSKSYDADELGLVWIKSLLKDVVAPLKLEHELKVVMVGHSLGARAQSMGVFAAHAEKLSEVDDDPVDLLVGLAAAFSINRFIPGKGVEGAPFANFSNLSTEFVYTWSDADTSGKVGMLMLTPHIHGTQANTIALDSPKLFNSVAVQKDGSIDLEPSDIKRVYHIDATQLMKYKTYDSSGGAHSDIYRPESANFLWSVIQAITQKSRE